MANERHLLSTDERAMFADIAEFNRARGREGFTLRDRDAAGLRLRGVNLTGAAVDNVAFSDADFRGAVVRAGKFTACEFVSTAFDLATFHETEFTACLFHSCTVTGASFADCRFTDTRIQDCTFDNCRFPDARFSNCPIGDTTFRDCSLLRAEFAKSKLGLCVLRRCDLSGAAITDSLLRKSRFANSGGLKFAISGGEIVRSGFEEGMYTQLSIKAASINGLTLENVNATDLHFEDLPAFAGLRARKCTLTGLKLLRSKEVVEPCFIDSTLRDFEAAECELLCPRFPGSTVEKAALIDRCAFQELDLSKASFSAAVFKGCTFSGGLNLAGAALTGLRLVEPVYADDYTPSGRAIYRQSDKFKGSI